MKGPDQLVTPREREELYLLSKGLTYKEISGSLEESAQKEKKNRKNNYKTLKMQNKINIKYFIFCSPNRIVAR